MVKTEYSIRILFNKTSLFVMETEPPKSSWPVTWQVLLLLSPAVVGLILMVVMPSYDGFAALLVLQWAGTIAAGIWAGIKLNKAYPNKNWGIKVLQFIGGFLLGWMVYSGITWMGCVALGWG
jgi:RsiW-degrading membrane proteinase PrsW (M82 family)